MTDKPKFIKLPYYPDDRGIPTVAEAQRHIPFEIKRVFWITDVPTGATRAGHSHALCHQVLVTITGTVAVKIENGIYNVDDKPNNINSLVKALIDAKTAKKDQPSEIQESLIILADRQMDFNVLSPVIRAGGQAGYSSFKFAVMPNLKTAQRK